MSCDTLTNGDDTLACFFCDTSDVAFGPVVYGEATTGAREKLEAFRLWLGVDPRSVPVCELMDKFSEWIRL